MQHSKRPETDAFNKKESHDVDSETPETGLLSSNKAKKNIGAQTEMLEKSATTSLLTDENTTMLLDSESVVQERRVSVKKLVMLDEVILVHTDEVIS